jgi:hypothetical protein
VSWQLCCNPQSAFGGTAEFQTHVRAQLLACKPMLLHRVIYMCSPRTLLMASAVLTGTVDFSTTILGVLATAAIMRAAPSQ